MAKDKVAFTLGFGSAADTTGGLSPTDMADLTGQLTDRGFIEPDQIGSVADVTGSFADFTMQVTPVLAPAVMGFAGAWVQAKFGRKVRIKTADFEVEANTAEEASRLVDMVKAMDKFQEG